MADRFPLVVDSTNNNIKELPSGDTLDLTGSSLKIGGPVTVGVDDTGYDVKFFGDTASAYLLWDTSADKLLTAGGATIDIVKDKLLIGGTAVTTTAAELNLLDNVSGLVQADFTKLAAVNSSATELNLLSGLSGTVKTVGKETIWVPATAMYPNTTAGCSALTQVELSNGPELKCLDFDTGSDEHAQFTVGFPKSWNLGTVTFQVFWTSAATDTGTCAWGLQGVGMNSGATIDATFGTAVVVSDAAESAANKLYVTGESGAVTIAGTPADDDLTIFQIFRDVSADAMEEDARLLGIKLFYTTDATNDA